MSSYRINSSGIWNIKQARDSKNNSEYPRDVYGEALVVAGGGSGGGGPNGGWQDGSGGGGGAGGLLYSCFIIIPGCQYNIAVGAGGTAPTPTGAPAGTGTNGNNSCFGSCLIACGGGRGGDRTFLGGPHPGANLRCTGGSGGGAESGGGAPAPIQAVACTSVPGIVGQGCAGGASLGGAPGGEGGGGGGAGQVGNSPANPHAPVSPAPLAACPPSNGGNGLAYAISGAPTFYAGGGGGGRSPIFPGLNPLGGAGGGGRGANPGNPAICDGQPGSANLGGGGGGTGTSKIGSAGGSGVVFLRVPNLAPLPVGCSGVNSEYLCAGFKVYRWTGSGSITFN